MTLQDQVSLFVIFANKNFSSIFVAKEFSDGEEKMTILELNAEPINEKLQLRPINRLICTPLFLT